MENTKDRITLAAKGLEYILSKEFGGKPKGRYRISRSDLLTLSGKKTFNDDDIKRFQTMLQQKGLILIDLGTEFAVLEEKNMFGYRKVTKAIIEKYTNIIEKKYTVNDKNQDIAPKKTKNKQKSRN